MEVNHSNDLTAYKFSEKELEDLKGVFDMPLVKAYFSTLRNHVLRLRLNVDLMETNAEHKIVAEDAYCKGQTDLLLRLTPENIANVE